MILCYVSWDEIYLLYEEYNMVQNMSDSNATPSVRGWDFQINAAIYMFLLDTKNTKTINVESKTEDIEIENSSGSISFLQAKSCFNPNEDNRKWGENLKKSLATLSKAYEYNRDESFKMIFNYSDVFGMMLSLNLRVTIV